MIGILTEKPSAMRNFAKALGGTTGTFNGEQYVLTAARGHLYEFADPKDQVPKALHAKYSSWDVQNLPWDERDFSWERQKKTDTSSVLAVIKKTLSTCSEVVIATDDDPTGEGELLAWEILEGLNIRNKKFSRMYFTDESEKEIRKAFKARKPIASMQTDMDYVKANYRAQWDLLSMQFTRIATACVGYDPKGQKIVLRQGRLKSVMVKMVGDQLKKIDEYKEVPFYSNKFRDENGVVYTNKEEPKYPQESQVPKTYHASDVVKDKAVMQKQSPPRLIDLATLSARLASHGYKAKEVLAVYQKMYEAQVVSYPRTEDKVITPEQFNDLLPKVDAIAKVVGVDSSLLTHRTPRSSHVKTGGAHGANRPGPNVPGSLAELDVKYGKGASAIYDLLAHNYLAMLAEDYEYESQSGHVKDYPKFVGTASVPKKMGWKVVFDADAEPADDENAKGLGTHADPFVAKGVNPKPASPTMKWLMKQLEKNDVGTGATRTSIYADVTSSSYKFPLLAETKGRLSMTPYGQMSYLLLENTKIGDVVMTEQLMQEMRDIAAGKKDPSACLRQMQAYVTHDITAMNGNKDKLKTATMTVKKGRGKGKETVSMASMASAEYYEGNWNGKDVRFKRVQNGHSLSDQECETLINGGSITCKFVSKAGNDYEMVGKLANKEYNGHKYVGVDFQFPDKVPESWLGYTFTDDERTLLEAGKEVFISGLISKKTGRPFSAKVKYGVTDRGTKGFILNFDKN